MRAWVTGATGFVGSALVARLVARGDQVVALVRPASRDHAPRDATVVESVLPDVTALSALPAPDVVFHCAAAIDGSEAAGHAVHVQATLRLAELAPAARFVQLSTTDVLSPTEARSLSEDCTGAPRDAYGRTKLEGERRLLALRPDAIVLRPPGIYGPGSRRDVILHLARRIERGRYFQVGDGQALSSWIFVETLLDAMLYATEHRELSGPYLVDDGRPISRRDLAREIARGLGRPERFRELPVPLAKLAAFAFERALPRLGLEPPLTSEGVRQACTGLALDTSRWKATGFVPRFSLRAAIAKTLEWGRAVGRLSS